VDICRTAERVYRNFQNKTIAKEIRFQCHLPGQHPVLYADNDKVTQIFNNLISNAIRYTEKGGDITVKVEPIDGYVRCSVRDTGAGIARENIPRLFTKFERFGQVRETTGYKGTGLGLAISKTLVEKHHGNIWVESMPGKGSTFYFTLKEVEFPKILVVDDDEQIIDLVHFSMEDEYRLHSAQSGEEAIEKVFAERPSIIILDMKLPGMTGYEVLGRLKQDTRSIDIPIIIISAYSIDEKKLVDIQQQSTIPVFEKPFKPEALAEKVKEMLEE